MHYLWHLLSHYMQTNSNQSQTYFLQRPNSPKSPLLPSSSNKNISLNLSIGANQNPSHLIPHQKFKLPDPALALKPQPEQAPPTIQKLQQELRVSVKENKVLREENSQLRRELLKLRKEPAFENSRSMEKISLSPQVSDLRGTIKKQMGELRDLRAKVDALTAQCRLYEQTVEKMEERTRKLCLENNKKKTEIQELQSELGHLTHLKEKTNGVVRLYNELESKFNANQLEWLRWKQNWFAEKQCYLERIRQLERILQRTHR